jgi:hypothetical protein
MKVFISHGKEDTWVAEQISRHIKECGASTFLDEADILKGDNFKTRIYVEISICDELVVLFTPWSSRRFWIWIEIGAAWGQGKRIIAILYGMQVKALEKLGGSKAILEDINMLNLNDFNKYKSELKSRV